MENALQAPRRQGTWMASSQNHPRRFRVILYNLPVQTSRTELVDFLAQAGVNWASIRGLRIPGGLDVDHAEDNHTRTENAVVLFNDFTDASRVAYLVNRVSLKGHTVRVSIDTLFSLPPRPCANRSNHRNDLPSFERITAPLGSAQTAAEHCRTLASLPVASTQFLYNEPLDRMMAPSSPLWGFYAFRRNSNGNLPNEYVFHRLEAKSLFVVGTARTVDVPLEDESCAVHHALIQFRALTPLRQSATPCLFDNGSTNGSFVNGSRVTSRTYVLLHHKDVLRFGSFQQDFVLMREGLI